MYLKYAFVVVLLHLIVLHEHTHTQVARCTLHAATIHKTTTTNLVCNLRDGEGDGKSDGRWATGAINQNPRESVKNIDIEYR